MTQKQRPTTTNDLPDYARTAQVAVITLTPQALMNGVLTAVDDLINTLIAAYGEDNIACTQSGETLRIIRGNNGDELDEQLKLSQHAWDVDDKQRNLAQRRDQYQVGDIIERELLVRPSYTSVCTMLVGCVLHTSHYGQCMRVDDDDTILEVAAGPRTY